MRKKLTRSRNRRMISGVLGGLSDYFNISPTMPRLLFVLFVIVTGLFPGVIGYIIAAYVLPEDEPVISSAPTRDDDPAV